MAQPPARPWWRWAVLATAVALLLAGLLLGAAAWFFSGLIAAPGWMKQTRAKHREDVALFAQQAGGRPFAVRTEDGLPLRGIHVPARPNNDRFVVMVHGYCANLLEYREQFVQWRQLGFDVFLYDQRFCGASEGDWTTCGVRESRDLDAVLAEVRRTLGPQARGGLHGRSMGGAVVLMRAAAGPGFEFVVSECPFSSFVRVLKHRLDLDYAFIPRVLQPLLLSATAQLVRWRFGFDLAAAAPERVVADLRVPVLLLVTAEDRYVPPVMTQEIFATVRGPKQLKVFPRGDHGQAWRLFQAEYDAELRQFLTDRVPGLLPR